VVGVVQDDEAISTYGLIDVVQTNDNIRDSTSALAASDTKLAIASVPVVTAGDFALDSAAPVLVEQLIPGALIQLALRTSGVVISGTFRLGKVATTASAGKETVTISVQPVGTATQEEGA